MKWEEKRDCERGMKKLKDWQWKAGLSSRRKKRVRVVRQTETEGWKATGLDQEVTNCGQHLDSKKCSSSWWGCEVEESCTWSEGSAWGHAGHLLCAKPLSLGSDLELSKTNWALQGLLVEFIAWAGADP